MQFLLATISKMLKKTQKTIDTAAERSLQDLRVLYHIQLSIATLFTKLSYLKFEQIMSFSTRHIKLNGENTNDVSVTD